MLVILAMQVACSRSVGLSKGWSDERSNPRYERQGWRYSGVSGSYCPCGWPVEGSNVGQGSRHSDEHTLIAHIGCWSRNGTDSLECML